MLESGIKFPIASAYNKVISKTKIYENAKVNSRTKDLFVKTIKQIVWSYKLSPESINLPPTDEVNEVQIITIVLKNDLPSLGLLEIIDKAILSPIIFILHLNQSNKYVACYKRQSVADKTKNVLSSYFASDWLLVDNREVKLPVALSIADLYYRLLELIIPITRRNGENMAEYVARAEQLVALKSKCKKLEQKLNKEIQFNLKVEIKKELDHLLEYINKIDG